MFIGGGYIAFEFTHIAIRVGSQVTIAHRGDHPLELFDPDLVEQVVKRTRELGVDVQLGTEVVGVEKGSGQLIVRATASGQKRTFEADMVVHAAGLYRRTESKADGTESTAESIETTDPETGLTHQVETRDGKPEADWLIQRNKGGTVEKDKIVYKDGSYNERPQPEKPPPS